MVDVEVGLDSIKQIKKRKELLKLADIAFKVAQGIEKPEALQTIFERATEQKDDHLPLTPVTDDLSELISHAYQEQGYRWRLDCLNKSFGSLREGDFGFIFARPETGKTTFLASEVSNFALQTKKPIIWLNNEEQGEKVKLRIYQAFFGIPLDQLLSNIKKYHEKYLEATNGNVMLFDSATISRWDVEKIISKINPGIVIYDQLPKIKGFAADRDDLRLGTIYQWARELAKGSHAAIGVQQADGTAEGVRYLTMEHVANAKTAVQAEADWILGIGKTHDVNAQEVRYLSISKNKLLGDPDTLPNLKHGRFEVIIRPQIARYEDVVNYG